MSIGILSAAVVAAAVGALWKGHSPRSIGSTIYDSDAALPTALCEIVKVI